mmetsp:Transcript_30149/g.38899  ORF Transcript_30149/g.38899 Transcript_30149/m.38899 type:complete len:255 (+) Transcript_30149:88-852(+)
MQIQNTTHLCNHFTVLPSSNSSDNISNVKQQIPDQETIQQQLIFDDTDNSNEQLDHDCTLFDSHEYATEPSLCLFLATPDMRPISLGEEEEEEEMAEVGVPTSELRTKVLSGVPLYDISIIDNIETIKDNLPPSPCQEWSLDHENQIKNIFDMIPIDVLQESQQTQQHSISFFINSSSPKEEKEGGGVFDHPLNILLKNIAKCLAETDLPNIQESFLSFLKTLNLNISNYFIGCFYLYQYNFKIKKNKNISSLS